DQKSSTDEEEIGKAISQGQNFVYDRDRPDKGGATALNRSRSINRQRLVAHSTAMESIQAESEPIDEEDDVPPGGIPARNARGERLLLFIGIIDILQSYRLKKKLEHTWKSMIHDGTSHFDGSERVKVKGFFTTKVALGAQASSIVTCLMLHSGLCRMDRNVPTDTVSVHRPGFYAQRFQDFMAKTVFKKIPSRKYYPNQPLLINLTSMRALNKTQS
ncbi:hypothetical protein KQX54_003599, partial [Cotesia glomerata]